MPTGYLELPPRTGPDVAGLWVAQPRVAVKAGRVAETEPILRDGSDGGFSPRVGPLVGSANRQTLILLLVEGPECRLPVGGQPAERAMKIPMDAAAGGTAEAGEHNILRSWRR